MTGTKQRILEAALDLFSDRGYEAVSVEQLAAKVGIKAPSLYKHYPSKQSILDSLIETISAQYERQSGCAARTARRWSRSDCPESTAWRENACTAKAP